MTNSARVMFGYHLEGLTLHFDFKNASRKLSSPYRIRKLLWCPDLTEKVANYGIEIHVLPD